MPPQVHNQNATICFVCLTHLEWKLSAADPGKVSHRLLSREKRLSHCKEIKTKYDRTHGVPYILRRAYGISRLCLEFRTCRTLWLRLCHLKVSTTVL